MNFDEIVDRHGTSCCKWNIGDDLLPFGLADMEFACPPPIIKALHERVDRNVFGYTTINGDDLFNAVCNFGNRQYRYRYDDKNMFYVPGVVPALGYLVNIMSQKGDGVIIQTPVYGPFHSRVTDMGRTLVTNPLVLEDNIYRMDLVDFEQKIIDNNVTLFILCNPHNPVGRAYTDEELQALVTICQKHNVKIISDEIHRDLIRTSASFCPLEKAAPHYKNNIVTCIAPSKTFNLAGMVFSFVVINDPELKQKWTSYVKVELAIGDTNICSLSRTAALSAYTECDHWLQELREYLDKNMLVLKTFLDTHFPLAKFEIPSATYLTWIDLSAYYTSDEDISQYIAKQCGILIGCGSAFCKDYPKHIRFNVACPTSMLEEGLNKLLKLKG